MRCAPVAKTQAAAGTLRDVARTLAAFTIIPLLIAAGPTVTVHKIDDSVVTGELTAVSDGKLTVHPASAQPAVIPLADVLVVTTSNTPTATPAPAPVVTAAPPPPEQNLGPSIGAVPQRTLLGSLVGALGGGPPVQNDAPVVTAPPAPVAITKPTPSVTTGHLLDGVLELANGDHFHGGVISWDDKTAKLQIADVIAPLDVPGTQVISLWTNDESAVRQAKALAVDTGPEDVAFVRKDSGVIAVKGLVRGVASDGVAFRYDDKDRKIDRAKIVGLLLRSNSPKPDPAFHQIFHTVNSDAISGAWIGLEKDSAVIQTASGATIKLPMKSVVSISAVNGRVVYVSDLKPSDVEQAPYFGRLIPYKLDQSLDGGPMTLTDGPHAKGIAVHSRCVLTYDLGGEDEQFKTVLGFEQPAGKMGRVAVRVLGDGRVLFTNPDLRGDQPAVPLDLDVTGVKKLVLEVDFGADQDSGDRVDWADARLTRAGVR